MTPRAEIVEATSNAFVVRLLWRPTGLEGNRELFQVVRMRDDKIREMADYRTARAAAKAAK
ncbi:MAG TPA: hypothetical protein VLL25_14290 [Acidimicrobiales bacterium]|nr:hypothetical protein [Acidimicrobiales bacterium]